MDDLIPSVAVKVGKVRYGKEQIKKDRKKNSKKIRAPKKCHVLTGAFPVSIMWQQGQAISKSISHRIAKSIV